MISTMVTRQRSLSYFALRMAKCHQLLECMKHLDSMFCDKFLSRLLLTMARISFVEGYFRIRISGNFVCATIMIFKLGVLDLVI